MGNIMLQCEKCGVKFPKPSLWAKVLGGHLTDIILVDSAPSPVSVFRKERCPKCGSTKLKKV